MKAPFRPFVEPVSAVHTARRCGRLLSASDRNIVRFLQWQSWQPGGLAGLADKLIAASPDEFGERAGRGRVEFEDICMPVSPRLKPETPGGVPASVYLDLPRFLWAAANGSDGIGATYPGSPDEYSHDERSVAGASKLSGPAWSPALFDLVRDAMAKRAAQVESELAGTSVATAICECMAACARTHTSALVWGKHRIGKSFSAANWVARHPGLARLVECPSYQDEKGFLVAVGRALGIPVHLDDRTAAMREAVKAALPGMPGVMLVLDEASRLWPSRGACPHRVLFIMELINAGVPVVFLTLRDWFAGRERTAAGGWRVEQLDGRLQQKIELPDALAEADIAALVDVRMPALDRKARRAVCALAGHAPIPLAWIESVSSGAADFALAMGRQAPTESDFREIIARRNGQELAFAGAIERARGKRAAAVLPQSRRTPAAPPPTAPARQDFRRQNLPADGSRLVSERALVTVET
ncbi:MAG TPA: hypothetical protein PKM43_06900 [Verrucomicrobiota bacterium]|nr:hypothetical protein [Verrucomicrobiota bacterium]